MVSISGNYMATGGADRQIKIWDLRKFQCTHSYFSIAGIPSSLDISQRRVLGVGHANSHGGGVADRRPADGGVARWPGKRRIAERWPAVASAGAPLA